MEKNTALSTLEAAAASLAQAERSQTNAAIEAREAGASWEEIGQRLGITKQRAHQRYNEATRDERAARYAAAEARGKAKGEKILEEITTKVWKTTKPETSKIVDEDRAGDSVTPSIFLEPEAPAKTPARNKMRNPKGQAVDYATNGTPWTPESAQETYIDNRPKQAIPGPVPTTAQPGTGKGPHACPRCGSTNHYTEWRDTAALYPECTPTRYDSPRVTDFMNARIK